MNIISQSDTDFFLTGGTALSRAYYNHRYSEDLDFFLSKSQTYDEQLDKIFALLRENGFSWDEENDYSRVEYFTTFKVRKDSDTLLKLDFVNDRVPHYGEITKTNIFYRTDSVRNILSNKLSAIFRYAAKDIVDIREIALHETIDWSTAIQEARQKEAGLELIYISEILSGMPKSEFDTISWTKKPDWDEFKNDINKILQDITSSGITN
jgi:predicted nucleotidyltransferase component of viral defense system